jgi:sigma-E factor negative regulatory protein RseB
MRAALSLAATWRRSLRLRAAWLPYVLRALLSAVLPALWLAGAAQAQSPSTTAPPSPTTPVAMPVPLAEARQWLGRMHEAARQGSYQGTLVYTTGGQMATSRVWHFVSGADTYERLEAQDGRQQRIVRHNDTVHTLWPQAQLAVIERRETLAAWSTTPQTVDPQALEQYELRREGGGRVAGRDAAVLVLEPRDALRYAQRLWADLASGLMLRADVLAEAAAAGPRAVLESTAFTEVETGVRGDPQAMMALVRKLEGWRVLRPAQRRTELDAEGWTLARPVPGFRLAGAVRRGLERPGEGAGASEPVLQAVFTDGLAHVSVFVEPFRPQRHRQELQLQQGATTSLMQRRGEHWVTVVGDVPVTALRQFALALERARP